jgi:hypothetical protein
LFKNENPRYRTCITFFGGPNFRRSACVHALMLYTYVVFLLLSFCQYKGLSIVHY